MFISIGVRTAKGHWGPVAQNFYMPPPHNFTHVQHYNGYTNPASSTTCMLQTVAMVRRHQKRMGAPSQGEQGAPTHRALLYTKISPGLH